MAKFALWERPSGWSAKRPQQDIAIGFERFIPASGSLFDRPSTRRNEPERSFGDEVRRLRRAAFLSPRLRQNIEGLRVHARVAGGGGAVAGGKGQGALSQSVMTPPAPSMTGTRAQ